MQPLTWEYTIDSNNSSQATYKGDVRIMGELDGAGFDNALARKGVTQSRYLGALAGDSFMAGASQGSSAPLRTQWTDQYNVAQSRRFAVGGTTTDQILANQIPQVLSSGARYCHVDGGINDIAFGTSFDVVKRNLITIWNTLLNANIVPFDWGMPPSNTGAVIGGVPESVLYADFEFWRQLYCRLQSIPHVHYWPLIAQANGQFAAGMNSDTRHPSALGEDAMASEGLLVLGDRWRNSKFLELLDRAAATTIVLPNAVSYGGVAGALPAGYSTTGTAGGTFAVEAGEANSFGNWLTTSYAGAQAVNGGWKGTQRSLAQLGWNVGDKIAFGLELKWTENVRPTINLTGGDVTFDYPLAVFQEMGAVGKTSSLTLYHEATITGGTNFNLSCVATSTGAGSFSVRRPVLYNMTKNGL